jgi:nicotinate-nucleotide adenylyltransferase
MNGKLLQKINTGLFFGSFNPIHVGHTAIANYILEYSELSEIWFIVTPQNPFKKDDKLANEFFRLEMTKLAIAQETRFKVLDIEFKLTKPSYTFNTLEALSNQYPHNNFVLLMGSDNILQINKWKNADKIIGNFDIIVYPRLGYPIFEKDLPQKTVLINAPLLDISSTLIRNSFAEGKRLSYFLSPEVFDFIEKKELYR